MANYQSLKAAIQDVVKTNGNNEITGALLQQSLLAMINSLGAGYQFMGIATPSTNPGTPDQNVFYIASTAGTYASFGSSISLLSGQIGVFAYNGTWQKSLFYADFETKALLVSTLFCQGIITKPLIGVIGGNGTYQAFSDAYRHFYLMVRSGDVIKIKARSNTIALYALLNSIQDPINNLLADFIPGASRQQINAGQTVTITASQDLFLYITEQSGSANYAPEYVQIGEKTVFPNDATAKTKFQNGKYPSDYNINGSQITDLSALITGASIKPITNVINGFPAPEIGTGYIGGNGQIQNIGVSGYEHYIIQISPGDTIKIKPSINNNVPADYLLLKSYVPNQGAQEFSDYAQGRQRIAAGSSEQTITAPSDAYYLIVTKKYANIDYTPNIVNVNGYNALSGSPDIETRLNNVESAVGVVPFLKYTAAQKKFEFYSNSGSRYASFIVANEINNSIVENVWRLIGGYIYDKNLGEIAKSIESGENEFTAAFSGFGSYQNFTGGYHGGELINGDANCFVKFFADGVLITDTMMASDFQINCSVFRYVQYSTLHKVNDGGGSPISGTPIFAHHLKDVTFERGKMHCKNVVDFSDAVTLYEYFSGLFCVAKQIGQYCIIPNGINAQCVGDNNSIAATDKMDPKVLMYSISNNSFAEITSKYVRGIDVEANLSDMTFVVWDRSVDSKYYRYILKHIPVSSGHIIETETEARFL